MRDSGINAAEVREAARAMAGIIAANPVWDIYDNLKSGSGAAGAFNESAYDQAFFNEPGLIAEIMPHILLKNTAALRRAFDEIGPWASYEVMAKFEDAMRHENLALAVAGCAYPEASREDLRGVLQKLWERDQARSSDDFIFTSNGVEIFRFFAQERFRDQCLGEALSWDALRPSLNQGTVQILYSKEHLALTFFPGWTGERDELSVSRENLAYARTAEKIMGVLEDEIMAGRASLEGRVEQAAALSLALIIVHNIFPDYEKFHVAEIPSSLSVKDFFDFKVSNASAVREMYNESGKAQMADELASLEILLGSMKKNCL